VTTLHHGTWIKNISYDLTHGAYNCGTHGNLGEFVLNSGKLGEFEIYSGNFCISDAIFRDAI